MKEKQNVIAIDGPAASGKSTVAAILAGKLSAIYVNTGNMYRAITLAMLDAGIDPENTSAEEITKFLDNTILEYRTNGSKEQILINGRDLSGKIRSPHVAAKVSKVAAIPEVRGWLVQMQRKQAVPEKIIVMEGRDIGTVVFPDAKWKFFLTASPEVRARRRLEQAGETPDGATIASVAKEIAERDRLDSTRKVAPLTKADDAILIDSSNLTIDEVIQSIICKIQKEPI